MTHLHRTTHVLLVVAPLLLAGCKSSVSTSPAQVNAARTDVKEIIDPETDKVVYRHTVGQVGSATGTAAKAVGDDVEQQHESDPVSVNLGTGESSTGVNVLGGGSNSFMSAITHKSSPFFAIIIVCAVITVGGIYLALRYPLWRKTGWCVAGAGAVGMFAAWLMEFQPLVALGLVLVASAVGVFVLVHRIRAADHDLSVSHDQTASAEGVAKQTMQALATVTQAVELAGEDVESKVKQQVARKRVNKEILNPIIDRSKQERTL